MKDMRWLVEGINWKALAAFSLVSMVMTFCLAVTDASETVCVIGYGVLACLMFVLVPRWPWFR